MLKGRDDIAKQLAEARIRVAIMAPEEQTVDIPEHSDLKPADYWNRAGSRSRSDQARPAISAGEENLLHLKKDRYPTENILIHEFAHTIHTVRLSKIDSNFQSKLEAAFEHAKTKKACGPRRTPCPTSMSTGPKVSKAISMRTEQR